MNMNMNTNMNMDLTWMCCCFLALIVLEYNNGLNEVGFSLYLVNINSLEPISSCTPTPPQIHTHTYIHTHTHTACVHTHTHTHTHKHTHTHGSWEGQFLRADSALQSLISALCTAEHYLRTAKLCFQVRLCSSTVQRSSEKCLSRLP